MNNMSANRDSYYRDNNEPNRQYRSRTEYKRKRTSITQIIHWIITFVLIAAVGIEGVCIYDLQQSVMTQASNTRPGINQVSDASNDGSRFVGEYYCNEWNGKPSTLSLKADGTGTYPTGSSMTWEYRDGSLHFYIHGDSNKEHIGTPAASGITLANTPFFKY